MLPPPPLNGRMLHKLESVWGGRRTGRDFFLANSPILFQAREGDRGRALLTGRSGRWLPGKGSWDTELGRLSCPVLSAQRLNNPFCDLYAPQKRVCVCVCAQGAGRGSIKVSVKGVGGEQDPWDL